MGTKGPCFGKWKHVETPLPIKISRFRSNGGRFGRRRWNSTTRALNPWCSAFFRRRIWKRIHDLMSRYSVKHTAESRWRTSEKSVRVDEPLHGFFNTIYFGGFFWILGEKKIAGSHFSPLKEKNNPKKPVVFFHSLGQEVWPKQDTLLGMVGSLKCWKLSDRAVVMESWVWNRLYIPSLKLTT